MVEFKCFVSSLTRVLKMVQMKGKTIKGEDKPLIDDCVLEIANGKISSAVEDANRSVDAIVKAELSAEKIITAGSIPVDILRLLDRLSRFDSLDEILVSYSELTGMITLERQKAPRMKLNVMGMNVANIHSKLDSIAFNFDEKQNAWIGKKSGFRVDTYIKIHADAFAEVIKDGEQLNYRSFPFEVMPDRSVKIKVKDEDTGESNSREILAIDMHQEKPAIIKSMYSYGFGNVFAQLKGEIEFWIANVSPIIIKKTDGSVSALYILATVPFKKEEQIVKANPAKSTVASEMEQVLKEAEEKIETGEFIAESNENLADIEEGAETDEGEGEFEEDTETSLDEVPEAEPEAPKKESKKKK